MSKHNVILAVVAVTSLSIIYCRCVHQQSWQDDLLSVYIPFSIWKYVVTVLGAFLGCHHELEFANVVFVKPKSIVRHSLLCTKCALGVEVAFSSPWRPQSASNTAYLLYVHVHVSCKAKCLALCKMSNSVSSVFPYHQCYFLLSDGCKICHTPPLPSRRSSPGFPSPKYNHFKRFIDFYF